MEEKKNEAPDNVMRLCTLCNQKKNVRGFSSEDTVCRHCRKGSVKMMTNSKGRLSKVQFTEPISELLGSAKQSVSYKENEVEILLQANIVIIYYHKEGKTIWVHVSNTACMVPM